MIEYKLRDRIAWIAICAVRCHLPSLHGHDDEMVVNDADNENEMDLSESRFIILG
jgi:hypothetical protein